MEPIFVLGHRNPDTDSIVSAMAYAALREALGDREYQAGRLGQISDETRRVLDHFGMEPPPLVSTVRTQIRDLDFDTPPVLHRAVPVRLGWEALQAQRGPAIPVSDDNGLLCGMLSPSDITGHAMAYASEPRLEALPLFNLLSVLEGQPVGDIGGGLDAITGEVVVDMPSLSSEPYRPGTIVLCGNTPERIQRWLDAGAACVILCQTALPSGLRLPSAACILTTPLDACRAAQLLFQAAPVERICCRGPLEHVHLDDYLDDVRDLVLKSRYRSYPILDDRDRVAGTLSRFHLLRPRPKRVVLVDHNETAQSVPGLEQAEILEIIDHHRLADIQTGRPIRFRNEPVGSTATIVAGMYQERGLMPQPKLAGLMAAAIVSDTVLFRSPTATDRDRHMARRLARLAGEDLEALGQLIFSAGLAQHKTAQELLSTDFKEFHIAGHSLGIGQITCADCTRLLERKEELLEAMEALQRGRDGYLVLLMLTDVLQGGTHLLCAGDPEIVHQAFNVPVQDRACYLPGVLSRKKQIIPALSALWG